MPEIENFHEPAQQCFELAKWGGLLESSRFLQEDIALQAFELLIGNDHDSILAHALGVTL